MHSHADEVMRLTQCVVAGASIGDGGETASGGAGGASAGSAGALDCPCHAWRCGRTDTAGGLGSQGAMHVRFSIFSDRIRVGSLVGPVLFYTISLIR